MATGPVNVALHPAAAQAGTQTSDDMKNIKETTAANVTDGETASVTVSMPAGGTATITFNVAGRTSAASN